MKTNNISIISYIVAAVFAIMFFFSEYGNNEMRRQIKERDRCIALLDSIVKVYLNAEKTDSSYIFRISIDQYGNKLSIRDLDSINIANELIIFQQDAIILAAKQKYNFDYSFKMDGNLLKIKLWDKKKGGAR